MKRYHLTPFLIFSFVAVLVACKKDNTPPKSPGNFAASIDNKAWSAHDFKCYYYPKFNDLYIYAVDLDSRARLEMVAYINPAKPVDTYVIEANGTHSGAAYINCDNAYFSDINDNSIRGNIELLKFDTISKKAWAKFNYNAYSFGKKGYVNISGGHFEDIEIITILDTVNLPYRGSYIQADFNDTTSWFTSTMIFDNHADAAIQIYTSRGNMRGLSEPVIDCMVDDNSSRNLFISIPLDKGLGTFPLYPETSPYSSNPYEYHFCSYYGRDNENQYLPVSGTVTVTYIDKPTRKIRGSFEITLKDPANRQLKISNGKFVAEKWYQ